MGLIFESVDEILSCYHLNETSFQQFFPVVLYISCVVLTFKSVDEILRCDYSNKTFSAVLSHGNIYYLGVAQIE